MDPFGQNVFYLLIWKAILAGLIALVLMVTCAYQLTAAFLIGANVALLLSLGLIVWSERLTDDGIVRTEAWRMLKLNQRPAGLVGRRWARNCLKETALRFAKAASAVAIALSTLTLMVASE